MAKAPRLARTHLPTYIAVIADELAFWYVNTAYANPGRTGTIIARFQF